MVTRRGPTPPTRRGDIWWGDFGPARGSGPAGRRPVLVVQADPYNRSGLATAIVAVITSNTTLANRPGNVFLSAAISGLPKDSVVNVTALATIDRDWLDSHVGQLPVSVMDQIDAGLRTVLGLGRH